MRKKVLFPLLALAACSAGPSSAGFMMGSPEDCAPRVAEALRAVGIGPDQVASTIYLMETAGGREAIAVGVAAWSRIKSCKSGYVVVQLDLLCHPYQTYSFGECRVKGVPEG